MNNGTKQSALPCSVVICTYNRAELLQKAIRSLCEQTLDPSQFEVIVVDNNSTDHTARVVADFRSAFQLRYIVEEKQGLSHARNRGWREAHGDCVAYLDDDAYVPSHWLSLALEVFDLFSPIILGGPVRDYFISARPDWYMDDYLLGHWVQSRERGPVPFGEWLFGGNLFARRKVLERVGGFSSALGMSGKTLAYAEEVLFIDAARDKYPDSIIYYEPDLYIYHLIRPEKTTLTWMARSHFSRGKSVARHRFMLLQRNPTRQEKTLAVSQFILKGFITMLKLVLAPFLWRRSRFTNYPNLKSYTVALPLILLMRAGEVVETLHYHVEPNFELT